MCCPLGNETQQNMLNRMQSWTSIQAWISTVSPAPCYYNRQIYFSHISIFGSENKKSFQLS